jgi:thymidylate synthase
MKNIHESYNELVRAVIDSGERRNDRTGVGTLAKFGQSISVDLQCGFPLLTTKTINFRNIVSELLWFIKGDDALDYMHRYKNKIWDANYKATRKPAIYHRAWRNIRGYDGERIDQLSNLIKSIKEDPYSRRHVLVSQIPQLLKDSCLDACHTMVQFYVSNDGELSCNMYQRSADIGLGLPYNVASYALFTELLAEQLGYRAKALNITIGDAHIYMNHIDPLEEQCKRIPYGLPALSLLEDRDSIFGYEVEDIAIVGYCSHPNIKMDMAV